MLIDLTRGYSAVMAIVIAAGCSSDQTATPDTRTGGNGTAAGGTMTAGVTAGTQTATAAATTATGSGGGSGTQGSNSLNTAVTVGASSVES